MIAKSYEVYLLGLYKAILSSIARLKPHLRVDCERDYKRLLSSVEKAGVSVFLEHLPAMGKHLDVCLSQRRLTASGVAFMAPYRRRGAIPRLFKGLYNSVFDESGELSINPDIKSIEFLRLLLGAAKKFRMACSDSSTWSTVDEFFKVDSEVRLPSLSWDEDELDLGKLSDLSLYDRVSFPCPLFDDIDTTDDHPEESDSSDLRGAIEAIQRTADLVSSQLGGFNPFDWKARHGPGVVSDLKKGKSKYSFPFWPEKLDRVFPFAEFAFHNYGEWADYVKSQSEFGAYILRHEPPSSLKAVPKTITGPRLIAAEPVSHQWCQQMVKDFLSTRIAHTAIRRSIDFRDQSKNGKLALAASHSESHATIDLSSASDRISCWVIERLFRRSPSIVEALHAVRTRWIDNDIDVKNPKLYKLRKFTTMGSTVTFPVQTILFACIAIGTALAVRGLSVNIANVSRLAREVQVFGDDIIAPIDSAALTLAALAHLGLKVNPSKTFLTGKFRESCGVDAYDGHVVSRISVLAMPVVTKPESVVSTIDVHNNFYTRGYAEVCEYLRRTVISLKRFNFFEISVGSGVLGWFSPGGSDASGLIRRYNSVLQRLEYRVTGLRNPASRELSTGREMLLQYFTEVSAPPISHEERLGTASVPKIKLGLRWEPLPE